MKLILRLLLLSFLYLPGYSQVSSKLDINLRQRIEKAASPVEMTDLFIKGDLSQIRHEVKSLGGIFKYGYGNICAVSVPVSQVKSLSGKRFIQRVELAEIPLKPLMDTALINNRITGVHEGLPPLPEGYTGKGVLIGIIDAGIYFNHPDFQDSTGKTRILYIWDQNVTAPVNPPQPFNYGEEWTAADIDNGTCTHVEPPNQFGHGTNVAGIAAGNGRAVGAYKGVAPEASIAVVAIDFTNFLSNFVDAVQYLFAKADSLGMPCVINASVGTYYGSRDARDLASQLIEQMLDARPGRVLVAAAGNAGAVNYHLGYQVEPDSSFTWFEYEPSLDYAYWELWADFSDFNQVYWSVGADNLTNYQSVGRTRYYNLPADYSLTNNGPGKFLTDAIYDTAGNKICDVFTYAELVDNVYHLEIFIPSTPGYLFRFMTKGNGYFDVWSHPALIWHSDIVSNVPPPTVLPEIVRYKFPDNKKTIVSSFTCSDKVITVGNYNNRHHYFDYNNQKVLTGETPGMINPGSSHGPTRDNRIKPDITATGSTTIATGNLNNIAALLSSGQAYKVAPGGMHNRNGGTSMASPVVAGVAALYLQQNPLATYSDVKNAIINAARIDGFTGTHLPNNTWGYGKLDAFAIFADTIIYGCTDAMAYNYNPSANTDDGNCLYQYCPVSVGNTGRLWIRRVCVGTACNWSGNDGGYGDYTHQYTYLTAGQQYPVVLRPKYPPNQPAGGLWRIWIDWNKDGDFDDGGELVMEHSVPHAVEIMDSIQVPLSVMSGPVTMRVMLSDSLHTPCDSLMLGEVEDYTLIITRPQGCVHGSMNASNYWIEKVCFNQYCAHSGNNGGYWLKNTGKRVSADATLQVRLIPGLNAPPLPLYWAIFWDVNLDNDFDDPGEAIFHPAYPISDTVDVSIRIPSRALNGKTRLRVAMSTQPVNSGCTILVDGEMEDYIVTLKQGTQLRLRQDMETESPWQWMILNNPVHDGRLVLRIESSIDGVLDARISSLDGRISFTRNISLREGVNTTGLDVSGLASGVYLISLKGQSNTMTQRFIIMR